MRFSKNKIIEFLKEKNLFEDVDQFVLDQLFIVISDMKESRKSIKQKGRYVNVVRHPDKDPIYQKNPAYNDYYEALKAAEKLIAKLALSPADRAKLKGDLVTNIKITDDGFDDL